MSPPPPDGWPERWPYEARAVPGGRGVVATTDRYASEVGGRVLGEGGNAVDAMVAASFALAVVNPEAGNVGGGGFLVLRTAAGEEAALDCRSTAPGASTPDMFLRADAPDASLVGGLSVAVPGSVLGLWEAHRRFGRLPWEALVEPAVALARGFVVEERYLRSLTADVVEGLGRFPESARVFLPGGRAPAVGDTLRQADLAATLERIRDRGPDGFYGGPTADGIVDAVARHGGVLTREDLASYRTIWRKPVRLAYRDRTVLSMPPPSSGGVALAEMAGILGRFDVGALAWHGAPHVHLLAEAWRRVYADRNHYLGDPAFTQVPVETLVSPAYAAWRARDILPARATPSAAVAPGVEAFRGGAAAPARAPGREGRHTTHLSVADGEGNAVAHTTTINTWYGSKLVADGTGVLLNDDMDDFTSRPGEPNYFGLVQGEANRIEPGKRPLSAMAPALVLDPAGRQELVLGTPGGATILTTVFQILANVVDHGMDPARAVAAPRVHHQHLPDRVEIEPGGLRPDVVEALRDMGHIVYEREEPSGDAMVVAVRGDGTLVGVADPRRGGVAVGV